MHWYLCTPLTSKEAFNNCSDPGPEKSRGAFSAHMHMKAVILQQCTTKDAGEEGTKSTAEKVDKKKK